MNGKNFYLTSQERQELTRIIQKASQLVKAANNAEILLKFDEGKSLEEISQVLGTSEAEIQSILNRFQQQGLTGALYNRHEDITTLRKAAYNHDWITCEEVAKRVFKLLKPEEVIKLVACQLHTVLPIVERLIPDVKWPRIFLLQFIRSKPVRKRYDFPFYQESYSQPGIDGFLKAMGFLAEIDQSKPYADQYTFTLAVEAISLVIHSRKLVMWAMEYPQEWEMWINSEGKPIVLQSMGIQSVAIQEMARDCWLTVADEVEKLLNESS